MAAGQAATLTRLAPYAPEISATRSITDALRATTLFESLISRQNFPALRAFPATRPWFNGPADDEEGITTP